MSDIFPDGFQMTELGPLPKEWRVVRLGDVAEFGKNRTMQKPKASLIPFMPMSLLPEDTIYISQWEMRRDKEIRSGIPIQNGDFLLAKITPSFENGKQGIVKDIPGGWGYASTEVIPIRPYPELHTEYLAFYLKQPSIRQELAGKMEGSTGRQRLPKMAVQQLLIPLPPLPEQRAIAHVLRTVQRAKEATEGVIAALKELKKSLMQHLFTYGPVPVGAKNFSPQQESEIGPLPAHWRVVRLGEVALLERGLSWSKDDEESNGIGVLSIPDILTNGRLNSFPRVHLSKQVTSNKLLVKGDVLLVGSSGAAKNVGRSGVLREEPASPLAFASFTIRLRGKPDALLQEFASYLIQSSWIDFAHFSKRAADGKYNLQLRQLQSAFIPLPPLDEQREIARILQAVDAKIAAEQARRAALEELFKSLLHELMSGQIRLSGDLTVHAEKENL